MNNWYGRYMSQRWWLLAIRLALFAVFLNALAPSISMARAAFSSDQVVNVAVCSAENPGRASVPAPGSQDQAVHFLTAKFCDYCTTHAGSFGALPVVSTFTPPSVRTALPVLAVLLPPVRIVPESLPPPRGPPAAFD